MFLFRCFQGVVPSPLELYCHELQSANTAVQLQGLTALLDGTEISTDGCDESNVNAVAARVSLLCECISDSEGLFFSAFSGQAFYQMLAVLPMTDTPNCEVSFNGWVSAYRLSSSILLSLSLMFSPGRGLKLR